MDHFNHTNITVSTMRVEQERKLSSLEDFKRSMSPISQLLDRTSAASAHGGTASSTYANDPRCLCWYTMYPQSAHPVLDANHSRSSVSLSGCMADLNPHHCRTTGGPPRGTAVPPTWLPVPCLSRLDNADCLSPDQNRE
eukprot:m.562408 g.562408  ORF g.562408 m.562408 type:complete len:139 (+) comp22222_c0_seq4:125-541(+)